MNKLQAMAQIMMLLNEDGLLKPGSQVYQSVRRMIADKIDRLGPDDALAQVMDRKSHLLEQIKIVCMWHNSARRHPPPSF